jgi:hypothetical protein
MTRPPRSATRSVAALGVLSLSLALAGCSSGSAATPAARDSRTDVSFNDCSKVACTGTMNGAAYEIDMPTKWNGTLLLYSHGYRQAQPSPPDFSAVDTTAEPAPGWPTDKTVGQDLLNKGYAIAGSAYATNGWAVADGVKADEDLHQFFVDKVGTPDRTLAWGDSLGGLITTVLTEKHKDWVSGSAPLCGVLAGPNKNLDLALDVGYAIKTLIYPKLKLTGYATVQEAIANWEGAAKAIEAAGKDVANGVPRLLMVADLVDAPSQTQDQDGSTLTSKVTAYAESVLTALGYGTFGRYDIEQRVGGNPSQNTGVDYSSRISADERSLIELASPGATDKLLALLAVGPRVSADAAARAKLAATGTPTGSFAVPMITMHTTADPLVLVQNETVYKAEATQQSTAGNLIQLFTVAPSTYPATPGAPYGAGHCNFTVQSRVAVVDMLDNWVRNGVYPGSVAIATDMGDSSGYSPAYTPGPWPAGS